MCHGIFIGIKVLVCLLLVAATGTANYVALRGQYTFNVIDFRRAKASGIIKACEFQDQHHRSNREVDHPEQCCQISQIDSYIEKFPPIEVAHIVSTAKDKHLSEYCNDYRRNLELLYRYLSSCCFEPQDSLVKVQVHALEELHVTLCLNIPFNALLDRNAKCIYKVLSNSDACLTNSQVETIENPLGQEAQSHEICPRLKSILNCYTRECAEACPQYSSNILNKLFKRVFKARLRVDCGGCLNVKPDVLDATKLTDSGYMIATLIEIVLIIIFLVVVRLRCLG